MIKKTGIAAAIAMGIVAVGVIVHPVHSQLVAKGLIHPVNHFPTWFSDTNGVTLQLCLDGDGLNGPCLYDEPIAGNAFSELTGFGPEAFWWSADAGIDMPNDNRAVVVLALEAAYANEDPVDGDQFAFGRVRLRVDTPVAGRYRIWHPYLDEDNGCAPEEFDAPQGPRGINVTRDVGGAAPFETMLEGEVGPFLVWDPAVLPAAPAGYVGDPQTPHKVVGGHCGINYFKIEGPVGANLDGAGGNVVQTDLFSVQGKLYEESATPPSIAPTRATYFRSTSSSGTTARINMWLEAPPSATVTVNGLPQANQNGPMTGDAAGNFYKRSNLNTTYAPLLPVQITYRATNSSGSASTEKTVQLLDRVQIISASWAPGTQTLSVVAESSDRITSSARPKLTLRAGAVTREMTPGTAGRYSLSISPLTVPPARVSVSSSRGGSDTEEVAD